MEIEVGEYVRLKNGLIGKFYNIGGCFEKDNVLINFEEFSYEYTHMKKFYNDIKSHSKNIIDLIEVGDVIKFKELAIEEKYGTIVNQIYILDIHDNDELNFIKEEIERKGIEIISIVTHEQFESIEYKVEEDK